jgi:uncharacterized protein YqeY
MDPKEQLSQDLKAAMKSGDAVRKRVVRDVMATLKEAELQRREDLIKKALKKHNISRPTESDAETLAAYQKTIEKVIAEEQIETHAAADEAEFLGIVQKQVKQRQDSLEEAKRGGREDIAAEQEAEIAVLAEYLPKQLSREEVEAEARALIEKIGASGAGDMGKVMGPLMGRLKGRADGKLISDVVRALLAE